jgi:two-component system, cell cycle response regulator
VSNPARILVVDDVPAYVKQLAAILELDHYVVSEAADGFEALAKIESERPDLVLLNVMMPRLDGFETCRRIKADPSTACIPVVLVTALADEGNRARGLAAGADDYVTKPFNDRELMARVRELLSYKRAGG